MSPTGVREPSAVYFYRLQVEGAGQAFQVSGIDAARVVAEAAEIAGRLAITSGLPAGQIVIRLMGGVERIG